LIPPANHARQGELRTDGKPGVIARGVSELVRPGFPDLLLDRFGNGLVHVRTTRRTGGSPVLRVGRRYDERSPSLATTLAAGIARTLSRRDVGEGAMWAIR
jgi:hypothetical protein